jgi:hypothetical protein
VVEVPVAGVQGQTVLKREGNSHCTSSGRVEALAFEAKPLGGLRYDEV